jgi:YidC/Oxa1 family membrane protein insertase
VGQIIDAIVGTLAGIIAFFANIGGGNTAIGIILFTIAVRLAILPLTLKAVRSSRAMQQLQPYIKEINDKYKTKPGERLPPEKAQKKQSEIMGLYGKYGVNPAAGCLPILIQIPIFFAVYAAVTRSIGDPALQLVQNAWNQFAPAAAKTALLEDRGFLWVPTLSRPDPLFILPVLMVVFQFVTQRMTVPRGGYSDEQQQRINNIMQWVPIIFGITAFNFPAGPVLYWVATSVFSTVQQYFITGWGSMGDLPGLGWLPVKQIKLAELKERDPSDKPAKKSFMDRLMENQTKMQELEAAKRGETTGSADASTEDDETPVKNTFGRKTDAQPGTLKSSGEVKRLSANGGTVRKPTSDSTESEVRAGNLEDRIRQAYRTNNQRPPKRGASLTDKSPDESSGNNPSGRKKK